MHGHVGLIKKIHNQSKIINTTMRHPKIKIGRNYCCRCKIWQNMLIHCLPDHVRQHFNFHKRRRRRKLNTNVLKSNVLTSGQRLVNLANVKHQILLNIIIFKRFMAPKNAIIEQPNEHVFFPLSSYIWIIVSTIFSLDCCFLWTNNFGCAICTRVFTRIIPLILLCSIKPFQKVNIYIKTSPNVCLNLQIMVTTFMVSPNP